MRAESLFRAVCADSQRLQIQFKTAHPFPPVVHGLSGRYARRIVTSDARCTRAPLRSFTLQSTSTLPGAETQRRESSSRARHPTRRDHRHGRRHPSTGALGHCGAPKQAALVHQLTSSRSPLGRPRTGGRCGLPCPLHFKAAVSEAPCGMRPVGTDITVRPSPAATGLDASRPRLVGPSMDVD